MTPRIRRALLELRAAIDEALELLDTADARPDARPRVTRPPLGQVTAEERRSGLEALRRAGVRRER